MTARTRTRPRWISWAALLATTVVVLAGCGDDDPEAQDPSDPGTTSSTATEEQSPSTTTPPASDPSDTGGPEQVAVPAYFVGKTPTGTRLFREFRNVEADNPVDEALALLAAGDALDPDYGTLLPDGPAPTLVQGDTSQAIGINLPSFDWTERPAGMSAKEAKLAVQQIVYTVQGVLQSRAPVEFFHDGLAPVLGIDQSSFKAAPQNSVLAFVNVTEPSEGASVNGTFTASGVANSFEATVPWEIRDPDGKQVLEGFATAEGWGDRLYPWESQVDVSGLPPGTYTFVARTDDPSDGEGAGPTEDTKTITVG